MQITYSRHGAYQQKERQIDENKIMETIEKPDGIINPRDGTQIAQKIFEERLLRVVYKKKDNQYVVITA